MSKFEKVLGYYNPNIFYPSLACTVVFTIDGDYLIRYPGGGIEEIPKESVTEFLDDHKVVLSGSRKFEESSDELACTLPVITGKPDELKNKLEKLLQADILSANQQRILKDLIKNSF